MLQHLKPLAGSAPPATYNLLQTSAYASAALSGGKYDYIIVGGGTAGCLLANKLSSDPSKKVLVLEAGEENKDRIVRVPAGLTRLFEHPLLDWNLGTTQPNKGNRSMYLARGKVLGGSSSTNATLYHRGSAKDYDSWGLKGWSSDDVLPWFKSIEDNNNPALKSSRFHSTGGMWPVSNPIYKSDLFKKHFAASAEVGIKPKADFNDWDTTQEGYGDFQVSITDKGRRCDAYHQFLEPVMKRSNLTVLTHAQTAKINIENISGKPTAVGVQMQRVAGGKENTPVGAAETVELNAGGEVLMTAGAIHSPQLLMLSGIGEEKHLKEHGIACHSNLPGVGQNLQDHPAVNVSYKLKESAGHVASTDDVYGESGNVKWSEIMNWAIFGKGPLTSTGCDRGAFVKTEFSKDGQPDLQLRYINAYALDPDGVSSYTMFGKLKAQGKLKRWPSGVSMQSIAVRPASSGSVRLTSAKITDSPQIDVNYCSDKNGVDMDTLRAGVRLAQKMAKSSAWAPVLDMEGSHPHQDCTTDAQLDEYITKTMHSANSVVGTCAMGSDTATGAVVSAEDLTVHGIASLRVIDASVLPTLPGGQTGAPTLMVAARAAAAIANKQAISTL